MNVYVCELYIDTQLHKHFFIVSDTWNAARREFIDYICAVYSLSEKEIADLKNPPYPIPGKYAIMLLDGGMFVADKVY